MENSQQDQNEVHPIGTVILTDEEQQECQERMRFFLAVGREQAEGEEGRLVVKEDHAETFQRGVIAYSLMRRAERLLEMAGGSAVYTGLHVPHFCGASLEPDLAEKACATAAKACAIFPLSVHFYDFACILIQVGKSDDAKVVFSTFLAKVAADHSDPVMQGWLKTRNLQALVQLAEQMI